MKLRLVCSALVAGLLACGSVHADVVFGNLGALGTDPLAASTNAGISDTTWLAHGFTVGGTNTSLQSVTLGLSDNDSTLAEVRLFANSGGSPSGSALATQTQTVSNVTPTLQTFDFGGYSLTAGSSYWLVVSAPTASSLFNWSFNDAGDPPNTQNVSGWSPLSPVTKISTDSGGSWSTSGGNRSASISISAVAVPEPSTYALAAVGLGLAGFMRARRRKAAV